MYLFYHPCGEQHPAGTAYKRKVIACCDVATDFAALYYKAFSVLLFAKNFTVCMKKSIARPLVYTSAALTRGGQGGAQCRPPKQPETEQKRRFPRYAACGKPPFIFVFALRSSGFAAFLLVFVRFRQRKIAPYASIGAKQVFIRLFTAARLCR